MSRYVEVTTTDDKKMMLNIDAPMYVGQREKQTWANKDSDTAVVYYGPDFSFEIKSYSEFKSQLEAVEQRDRDHELALAKYTHELRVPMDPYVRK